MIKLDQFERLSSYLYISMISSDGVRIGRVASHRDYGSTDSELTLTLSWTWGGRR